jgi:hypothetical protein
VVKQRFAAIDSFSQKFTEDPLTAVQTCHRLKLAFHIKCLNSVMATAKQDKPMQYDMAALGRDLNLPERYYLTREKGEQAFATLSKVITQVSEGEPLLLKFPPEQLIDSSFADEAVVRLYEALCDGTYGERTLLLAGLTEDSVHNVNAAIHFRNLKLAILAVDEVGSWSLIGQLERSLRETLDMLATEKTMTAPQLSDKIGSAVNTASNRLKRLYDGRLIRREHEVSEKGLQYIYHFWTW